MILYKTWYVSICYSTKKDLVDIMLSFRSLRTANVVTIVVQNIVFTNVFNGDPVSLLTLFSHLGTVFFLSPRKYKLMTITDRKVDKVISTMFKQ